ncbi:MAG TPA: restriction endonuclease subunit S [Gemmataceae bacterium]|nr:restriction endonuclease subunit S [Gemmataceae bacterium]
MRWLRAIDLNDSFVHETSRRLSLAGFRSAGKAAKLFRPGSLAISKSGTIGRLGILLAEMCGNRAVINIEPNDDIDTRFLFYSLLANRERIIQMAEGSVQKNLYVSQLGLIELHVPPRVEQQSIAEVLGALDDKIEQNRRTAAKLDGLARAMFKAWFVDFEPVKAKAAGATAFPGMPPEIFAVLPMSLQDSMVGTVPEGWEVKSLSEAFEVNPPRRLPKGVDAPYLDMKNMPTDGHAPDIWERRPHGSGMKFINGDTLVARITPCLENGKTAYVDFLNDGEVAWGSTEYIVLRPRPPLPSIFAYCLARMEPFRDYAIQNMSGTSGRQRVAASAMEHYHIAVPDAATARSFGDAVESLFHYIQAGKVESAKLAALRDYLLPRLLSGVVRVKSKGAS